MSLTPFFFGTYILEKEKDRRIVPDNELFESDDEGGGGSRSGKRRVRGGGIESAESAEAAE